MSAGARFQDRWRWDEDTHPDWHDAIQDEYPAAWAVIDWSRMTYGDDMGAFLCFMGVRLMEMRRVLRPDGSIYLHCDPTASHYLKTLMDAIFGRKQFRNEIAWQRTNAHNSARRYGPVHDMLLFYSNSDAYHWSDPRLEYSEEYIERHYRHTDPDTGRRFQRVDLTGSGTRNGESGLPWQGVNPTAVGRHWALPGAVLTKHDINAGTVQQKLDALNAAGAIYWPEKSSGKPRLKRYADELAGLAIPDVWTDINPISAHAIERMGYPTQKPLALYDRIIKASSNAGDVVLDPFCGCATTPIAAERLGRQWVGMDIWEGAHEIVIKRLGQEGLAGPDSSPERLMTFGDITYTTTPPVRTDDGEVAAPDLQPNIQRSLPKWRRLSHSQIRGYLEEAQAHEGGVICGGCGRVLEREFMQLDHIMPRKDGGANDISNRILLCGPCNRRKGSAFTLSGLRKQNRSNHVGWMRNGDLAEIAQHNAQERAERVRIELG